MKSPTTWMDSNDDSNDNVTPALQCIATTTKILRSAATVLLRAHVEITIHKSQGMTMLKG